jgi:transposase
MSTDALPPVDPAALPVDAAALPNDVRLLKSLVVELVATLRTRDERIAQLERNMDLLARKVFGRTSEKVDPRQTVLFEQPAEEPPSEPPPPAAPSVALKPVKHRGRRPKPDTLRRVDVIHDLTAAEKEALAAGGELVPLGEEVTEQYEWEPSSLYVLRHVQKKYVRRPARLESGPAPEEKNVVTAPKPPQAIAGGVAGPGLLACLITSRFGDHLPYHRHERIFARHGVPFSRQTTCDWALQLAELCRPVYELMIAEVLRSAALHTDDTPVKVRDAHGKRQYTGRFWNYVGDDEHPFSVFTFTPSRSRDGPGGPAEFLQDYHGYLQADAFAGYDALYLGPDARIVEVACWAHARRKFFEARTSDRLRAETALAFVRELYARERELCETFAAEAWRERSRAERLAEIVARRQAESRTILAEFAAWIEQETPKLLPKQPLRQALEYARTNWTALVRYCDDGRLDVDNLEAERAIRGIAIGRRNWLFCGSDRGGRAAAVHFSLIADCARHDLDPFAYLRDLFTRLPELRAKPDPVALRSLLPDRWKPN